MSMKKYKSDLFIIDTPLDGLEEGKERLSKGTKKGIFNLFMGQCKSSQTIIAENLDQLPNIHFEKAGVDIVRYGNKKGFIYLN